LSLKSKKNKITALSRKRGAMGGGGYNLWEIPQRKRHGHNLRGVRMDQATCRPRGGRVKAPTLQKTKKHGPRTKGKGGIGGGQGGKTLCQKKRGKGFHLGGVPDAKEKYAGRKKPSVNAYRGKGKRSPRARIKSFQKV